MKNPIKATAANCNSGMRKAHRRTTISSSFVRRTTPRPDGTSRALTYSVFLRCFIVTHFFLHYNHFFAFLLFLFFSQFFCSIHIKMI